MKNCPSCEMIQKYKSKESLNLAIAKNTNCNPCSQRIQKEKRSLLPNKFKILIRKCPKCGNDINYKTKWGYLGGISSGANCAPCSQRGKKLSEITKNKMSEFQKGRTTSAETKCKMRESATGKIMSSEARKKISKAVRNRGPISDDTRRKLSENNGKYWLGKHPKVTNETRRKLRISAIKRISKAKFNGNQVIPAYNISSISILEQKAKELGITDLQHAENGGEYHIKELGFWVDGYSKDKNIVIEYYEKHHSRQIEKDMKRQKEIMKFLNCEFIIIKQ